MPKIIEIKGFTFYYAGSSRPALTDVNISVDEGEIVIIAGPSGCGKSTLLRSINGLIPHMYSGTYMGEVYVNNLKVSEHTISEIAKHVGYVFQNPENQIFMFSVERDVAFGLENLGLPREEIRKRVDWAIDLLGIREIAHRAPHEISDGQKQRVAIAGVLAMKPKLLILDEPTSLLDPLSALDLISTVKHLHDTLKLTVIVVEHRLDLLVSIADRLIVMEDGRIIHNGRPRDVLEDEKLLTVGVGAPSIVRLTHLLKDVCSFKHLPLTSSEFVEQIDGA
ncbi:MAG: energy-coupling factor ABC transporter ATP-binding protein [Nitrososphaerales archaeon]